jgi:hypothetical protein
MLTLNVQTKRCDEVEEGQPRAHIGEGVFKAHAENGERGRPQRGNIYCQVLTEATRRRGDMCALVEVTQHVRYTLVPSCLITHDRHVVRNAGASY